MNGDHLPHGDYQLLGEIKVHPTEPIWNEPATWLVRADASTQTPHTWLAHPTTTRSDGSHCHF